MAFKDTVNKIGGMLSYFCRLRAKEKKDII